MFDPVLFAALMSSTAAFTPLSLFAAGEQGAWYDPCDFSTMFQDSAGTTPVTAVEQPVGLLLDKSKGLALGAELWAGFGTITSPWTSVGGGVFSINGSQGSNADLLQNPQFSPGKTYLVAFTLSGVSGGTLSVFVGEGAQGSSLGNGTYTFRQRASQTYLIFRAPAGVSATVSNISVRELPGNHASQSTAASRPVLSARVNLLTYSEQFDNAVWTKAAILAFGSGSVANATEAPNGTITADFLVPNTTLTNHAPYILSSLSAGVSYTASIYAKVGGYDKVVISDWNEGTRIATFDLTNVTAVLSGSGATVTLSNAAITSVGNQWYRCSVEITKSTSGQLAYFINSAASYAGNGTSGIYLWGADLRVTNVGVNLPAYQRVGAAVSGTTNPPVTGVPDYDTSNFPLYLKFDGVDDSLATGTIDPGAVDKAQVFAGVRKINTSSSVLAELSADITANNGSFVVNSPASSGFTRFASKGTTLQFSDGSDVSPNTVILSGLSDISGDLVKLRLNGVQVAQNTGDQGTGNYLAYPLYIGRRSGSTLPLNGNIYSMIVRFSAANLSDAQIASTETYVNSKTGAY